MKQLVVTGGDGFIGSAFVRLGWQPAETWESGLEKTIRWCHENTAWMERARSSAYREYYAGLYSDWLAQGRQPVPAESSILTRE